MLRPIHRMILELERYQKRIVLMSADGAAMILCLFLSIALRYGQVDFPYRGNFTWLWITLPVVGVATYWMLGLYNVLIRAMESRTMVIVASGAVTLSLFVAAASYMDTGFHIPRSVPPIFGVILFVSIGSLRVLARAYYQHVAGGPNIRENILIYGAGAAGTQLAATIQSGTEYRVVGFLDDNPRLKGSMIRGCRVHSPDKIGRLKQKHNVQRVLLAVASATPAQTRDIVARLAPHQLALQTIPPLSELVRGKANLQQLKEIRIDDLLGRSAVDPIPQLFENAIAGKRILVTGAGGSIGSELCRQILAAAPARLVLLEVSELALYNIENLLSKQVGPDNPVEIVYALGSVLDRNRVRTILARHDIESVYHAAAYKHVPIVEHNPSQGIKNNVFGTLTVAEEAAAAGVERFTLISTDKAVRPSNVMGASKRLAEQVIQRIQTASDDTTFAIVRFGNVLGSSGSVIHLFKDQIRNGGPVTVTHEEVTRYFMTIQEAAQLVIQAGAMADGGEVFVLDMGEPVKIRDLAELMIQLSGKSVRDGNNPEGDIIIEFRGLRPGEKLYEELLITDSVVGTQHPKIMRADERNPANLRILDELLRRLEGELDQEDPSILRSTLQDVVEGYDANGDNHGSGREDSNKIVDIDQQRSIRVKNN
jgi:FlaA1/EpsC-like NDP-sugar epimerase